MCVCVWSGVPPLSPSTPNDCLNFQEAKDLPDFNKISFSSMEAIPIEKLLPDSSNDAIALLRGFLTFRSQDRITARHVWLIISCPHAFILFTIIFLLRPYSTAISLVNLYQRLSNPWQNISQECPNLHESHSMQMILSQSQNPVSRLGTNLSTAHSRENWLLLEWLGKTGSTNDYFQNNLLTSSYIFLNNQKHLIGQFLMRQKHTQESQMKAGSVY